MARWEQPVRPCQCVCVRAGCSSKSFKLYSPKEPPNGNAFPPFHPGTMLDRDVGRHTPYGNQTDYRIFELNKRLQNWTEECDNLWWDAFTTEFFEDDAMLTITFCLEDGPKRYTIGRTLIPRYFRSIFEGGATELYYVLKHPKESFHNNFVSLDCDQCTMVTQHGKPMFTQVCVEGRLYLEFMFDDMMRIKTWHFSIRQHRELIPRSILAMHAQDPQMLDQLSKNITRCGLSNSTLNYLRLCVILEPMQELMSRHKTYSLSPRDCLKTCLFQKWQRMVAPPGESPTAHRAPRHPAECQGGAGQAVPSVQASSSPEASPRPCLVHLGAAFWTRGFLVSALPSLLALSDCELLFLAKWEQKSSLLLEELVDEQGWQKRRGVLRVPGTLKLWRRGERDAVAGWDVVLAEGGCGEKGLVPGLGGCGAPSPHGG
uniref:LIM domain binding 1 n=1 Tax=Dromaius novaehollandiae TaxID=8790 RepID=A0A8C4KBB6_DRONO